MLDWLRLDSLPEEGVSIFSEEAARDEVGFLDEDDGSFDEMGFLEEDALEELEDLEDGVLDELSFLEEVTLEELGLDGGSGSSSSSPLFMVMGAAWLVPAGDAANAVGTDRKMMHVSKTTNTFSNWAIFMGIPPNRYGKRRLNDKINADESVYVLFLFIIR